ncbi:MAG: hypothetical protein HY907_19875 [Deltaproteobacteria bacterium]|nr:hypothetical protein [Deltaproteobacteria bacterium]
MRAARVVTAVCVAAAASVSVADESETEVGLGHWGHWPELAVGPAGELHMVYQKCADAAGHRPCSTWYRRWDGAWGPEEEIPDSGEASIEPANGVPTHPRVAVDDGGGIHVAWAGPLGRSATAVRYARRDGAGWAARETIGTQPTEGLDLESFGGRVFVAAQILTGAAPPDDYEIRVYARDADGTGTWTQTAVGDKGNVVELARSFRGDRLLLAWWWSSRFVGYRLHEYVTEWGPETQIRIHPALPDAYSGAQPSLVEDRDGGRWLAFAAWERITGLDYEIRDIRVREPGGGFVTLSAEPLFPGPHSDPRVGTDGSGNVYVIWRDEARRMRYANRLAARGTWVTDGIFPTASQVDQPALAIAPEWHHLVWRDGDGTLRHNPRPVTPPGADADADGGPSDAEDGFDGADASGEADVEAADGDGAAEGAADAWGADDGTAENGACEAVSCHATCREWGEGGGQCRGGLCVCVDASGGAADGCGCRAAGEAGGAGVGAAVALGLWILRAGARHRKRVRSGRR